MGRWKTSNNAVYNVGYHLIWCPKYRRKVLVGAVETRLKELLLEKALELKLGIERMEIMPDHVHLFVKCPPTMPAHIVVKRFKGFTSKVLRSEFDALRTRIPTLWTNSYYCESVGHISESVVKKYIEDQKNK